MKTMKKIEFEINTIGVIVITIILTGVGFLMGRLLSPFGRICGIA